MSTTTIRWTVAKQLVTLLSAQATLAGAQVEPGWPGDDLKAECIWIESLDGSEDIPVMTSGTTRQITDDHFDIPLQIRVANRKNLNDTWTRLSEMCGAVENVVKDDPSLGLRETGVLSATSGQADMTCGRLPEGCLGFARMVVAVHARLF